MFKRYYLLFILIVLADKASAQARIINGFLLDSITNFPIDYGTITNATRKKTVHSDEKGFFRIEAAPNDFIYAIAKTYRYDTLIYSFLFTDTIAIFLSPTGTILPNVTVRTQYNKYQLDSIDRKTEFEQNRGTVLRTLSSSHPSGFGLTFNLDRLFKKRYKFTKRDAHSFSNREKVAYINYRFSPYLVAYYTHFKGDTLRDFMHLYTPDYNWLRQHTTNEDVMYYINDKLKAYKAIR
jgi:hypothetical protein